MDRLDNEDIGIIWKRHYPKRAHSESSKSLCLTLAMILDRRASTANALRQVLAIAGIPKREFDNVINESRNTGSR
jgi:hypothetical protein